jgi:hypothetical protein
MHNIEVFQAIEKTSCLSEQHPMWKIPHFDQLKEISKRVESVAEKNCQYVSNPFYKALEFKGLAIISFGWYLQKLTNGTLCPTHCAQRRRYRRNRLVVMRAL